MKTVLQIKSSARFARSHTRYLTGLFIVQWQSLRPADVIISRDTSNQKQPYKALLIGKRIVVMTSSGDAGYQVGGPIAHLNHLDPHIRSAFGFIGITEIDFVGVGYHEFPDDRIKLSLAAAESAVRKLASRLAADRFFDLCLEGGMDQAPNS
jgi:FMN-dependent NADH-azoreductase